MPLIAPEQGHDARAVNYPLARWYLRPLASVLADVLVSTRIRPWHITCLGLALGLMAAALVVTQIVPHSFAAVLVLLAWLCDRTDGQLARHQHTASAFGAWLDANIDELLDVVWHVAVAFAVMQQLGSTGGFILLASFLGGKYLFMYGLSIEPDCPLPPSTNTTTARPFMRALYHAPANADVRVHLLITALATNLLAVELVAVAVYYNLRWIVRYALVARRLSSSEEARHA